MSLYNIMNGVNPFTWFVLPMLDMHPDAIPRFRDCFIKDENRPEYDNHIHVYTRVGGGNRNAGFGEDVLSDHPDFVATFDDDFDSTYATYVFKIPTKWEEDFKNIVEKNEDGFYFNFDKASEEYKQQIYKIYPKLTEKLKTVLEK